MLVRLHLILPHALACWIFLLNGRDVRVSTKVAPHLLSSAKDSRESQYLDGTLLSDWNSNSPIYKLLLALSSDISQTHKM